MTASWRRYVKPYCGAACSRRKIPPLEFLAKLAVTYAISQRDRHFSRRSKLMHIFTVNRRIDFERARIRARENKGRRRRLTIREIYLLTARQHVNILYAALHNSRNWHCQAVVNFSETSHLQPWHNKYEWKEKKLARSRYALDILRRPPRENIWLHSAVSSPVAKCTLTHENATRISGVYRNSRHSPRSFRVSNLQMPFIQFQDTYKRSVKSIRRVSLWLRKATR